MKTLMLGTALATLVVCVASAETYRAQFFVYYAADFHPVGYANLRRLAKHHSV